MAIIKGRQSRGWRQKKRGSGNPIKLVHAIEIGKVWKDTTKINYYNILQILAKRKYFSNIILANCHKPHVLLRMPLVIPVFSLPLKYGNSFFLRFFINKLAWARAQIILPTSDTFAPPICSAPIRSNCLRMVLLLSYRRWWATWSSQLHPMMLFPLTFKNKFTFKNFRPIFKLTFLSKVLRKEFTIR